MKKKILLKSLVLLFLVTLYFNTGVNQANAYYACGSTPRCVDVDMVYGKSQYVASADIYFRVGEVVEYSWDNDSPGIMHVEFYIASEGKKMSTSKVAVSGGNDFGTYTIPKTGYYYLFGACEGGDDTRCQGGGRLAKF